MRILAIETATPCVGCALWADGAPLAVFTLVVRQRHAEVLLPAIDQLCRWAGWSVTDLEGVAVDVGPGLFTGLRVGLATARAISAARELPAAGVMSLEVLAYPHRRRPGLVVPVVDARRSEVYSAVYSSDGAMLTLVRPPSVASPEDLAVELAGRGGGALVAGDGAWRYREILAGAGAEVAGPSDMSPSPAVLAELGAAELGAAEQGVAQPGAGRLSLPFPAPVYLRKADVRIGWDQADGRVGSLAGPRPGPAAPAPPVTLPLDRPGLVDRPRLGS